MQEFHTEYRVGELVRVRADLWRITDVKRHRNCQRLRVAGVGVTNRGSDRSFLVPFDRPARARPTTRPRWARAWPLMAALASAIAADRPYEALRAASMAQIDLHAYQLEPALAFVRGLATRVLLADEVGLGKTIQAGLILAELMARGEIARALVLTPAGLREQWATELAARFSLSPTIADAAWLREAIASQARGANPWLYEPLIIASFDFIKRPAVVHAIEALVWDLLIVDEAHAVAGRSDRHVAVHGLARRARRVVLATATPHAGDDRAFAALTDLGHVGSADDDPLLMFRRSRGEAGVEIGRRTTFIAVRPTDAERRMHRLLDRYTRLVWREAGRRDDYDARLAMLVLRKRALSSAASLASSVARRLSALCDDREAPPIQPGLPLGPNDESERDDEEPGGLLSAPGLAEPTRERSWLALLTETAVAAAASESKLSALVRLIRRVREPVIVFSEYRDTLTRLERALSPVTRIAVLHGELSPDERGASIRSFTRGKSRVLLSTDAGGEGLNLQACCRLVVNYELPWSPARLEQRIGRVDRIGQAATVRALHLVARDTAENLVLVNLLARLGRLRAALGARFVPAPLPELEVARLVIEEGRLREQAAVSSMVPSRESDAGRSVPTTRSMLAAAEQEVRRSEDVRRLVRLARLDRCSPGAGDRGGAPLVGRLRRRASRGVRAARGLAPGAILVLSGGLVDPDGLIVESQVFPFHVPGFPARWPLDSAAREALRSELQHLVGHLEGEVRTYLVARLDDVARARRDALARIRVREGRLVHEARAPLARLLVQPGLFDRRALRLAEAARSRADRHIEELASRLSAPSDDRALCVGAVGLVVAILFG